MKALTYPTSPKDRIKDEPDGHISVPIPHWAHKMERLIPDKQIPSYCWFIHSRLTKSAGIWSVRVLFINVFHIQRAMLCYSV